MYSFFSSGKQIGQPKEISWLLTMAVLLHPPPESPEIQKVLLRRSPHLSYRSHFEIFVSRLHEIRTQHFSRFACSNKKLFIVLTKFAGGIRYITGRLVRGSLMWSRKCNPLFDFLNSQREKDGQISENPKDIHDFSNFKLSKWLKETGECAYTSTNLYG